PAPPPQPEPVPPPPPGALPKGADQLPSSPEPSGAPIGDTFSAGPRGRVPRTFNVRQVAVTAVAAVLTVALLGAGYALYALRGTGDVLSSAVPGDAEVYATVYLDPSAGQK